MSADWQRYVQDWTPGSYLRSETGPFLPRLQRDLTAWWGGHPDPDSRLSATQIDDIAQRLADYLDHYASPITPADMIGRFWEEAAPAPTRSTPGAGTGMPAMQQMSPAAASLALARHRWERDPRNPILPPDPNSTYECTRCMNPFAVRRGEELWLYYSGGDARGCQRICLATAPLHDPTRFTRRGVVLDLGRPGAFDAHWCVLPCVHRFGETWHLYYTGNEGSDLGLQSFPGIGLATSDDGLRFERISTEPIVTGDQTPEFPSNRGVAGGGTILKETLPDASTRYRMHYTLAVGTKSADPRVDQEKHCAVCHSVDGRRWTDHRLILSPRPDVSNEDIAVAAPYVWRDGGFCRMLYCGIGSRWGYYSISEAVSADGYHWYRGLGDENLSLAPESKHVWESQMVEYPALLDQDEGLRLFYCGNGYGATGIGTAVARSGAR